MSKPLSADELADYRFAVSVSVTDRRMAYRLLATIDALGDEAKNLPLLRSMYAQAEAEVYSLTAERDRYREALEYIASGQPAEGFHVAVAALGQTAYSDGCTCRRMTYDEAFHELHEHGCPALDDN